MTYLKDTIMTRPDKSKEKEKLSAAAVNPDTVDETETSDVESNFF